MGRRQRPCVFADVLCSVFYTLQRAVLIRCVLWKGLLRSRAERGSPSPSYEGVALMLHIALLCKGCVMKEREAYGRKSRACQPLPIRSRRTWLPAGASVAYERHDGKPYISQIFN